MSTLANRVEELIKECFPYLKYEKEYKVKFRGHNLFFDFCLPELGTMIEVQGEQHYKFVKFYHESKPKFRQHKLRDQYKKEWCELNKYSLVHIKYSEVSSLDRSSFLKVITGI